MLEISQMESGMRVWEISHMRKPKPAPGISARLPDMFRAAKPPGMSLSKWMEAAKVSGKFLNDIEDGSEPGIDKVERMALAAGLSFADFVAGRLAAPDTPATAWIPKIETIEALLDAVRPALSVDPLQPRALQTVASAFGSALGSLAEQPSREDNPDEMAKVLEHIAFSIRPYTPPSSSPKPNTQRHSSGKP